MAGVGSATEYVKCQAASENSRQDCTTAALCSYLKWPTMLTNATMDSARLAWHGMAIGHRRQTARYKVFRALWLSTDSTLFKKVSRIGSEFIFTIYLQLFLVILGYYR